MAVPRVFVSSTCYDLKHIRENLKYFIKNLGYESVLSDDGDVYYDTESHTHDACLKEVETCQIFILIIGGRYGGEFNNSDKSITNHEYKVAVEKELPIFTLVESAVYGEHFTYAKNKKDNPEIYQKVKYPNSDSTKIFDFIDEVRKQKVNNGFSTFHNYLDIETYLKKQWAGMLYDLLYKRKKMNESKKTNKLLESLEVATSKSEQLIKILLESTDENASSKINNVEMLSQAKHFGHLFESAAEGSQRCLIHFNGMDIVANIEEMLNKSDDWLEFMKLVFEGDMYEFGDEGRVIHNRREGHLFNVEKFFKYRNDLEKSFKAFKSISAEDRKEIILDTFDIPF